MATVFDTTNTLSRSSQESGYVNARKMNIEYVREKGGSYDYSDFRNVIANEDPTFLSFKLELDEANSPLFMYENGAMEFLERRKKIVNLDLLKRFKTFLLNMIEKRPWYFTNLKIEGPIDNISVASENKGNETDLPFILTFSMWEDVAMNAQTIFESYKRAVYDFNFLRWELPENLRKFNLKVKIGDARTFKASKLIKSNTMVQENPIFTEERRKTRDAFVKNGIALGDPNQKINLEEISFNAVQPYKEYLFQGCEIALKENMIDEISNESPKQSIFTFTVLSPMYSVKWVSADGKSISDALLHKYHLTKRGGLASISKELQTDNVPFTDNSKEVDKIQYTYNQRTNTYTPKPKSELLKELIARDNLNKKELKKKRKFFKFNLSEGLNIAADLGKKEIQRAGKALSREAFRKLNDLIMQQKKFFQDKVNEARTRLDRKLQQLVGLAAADRLLNDIRIEAAQIKNREITKIKELQAPNENVYANSSPKEQNEVSDKNIYNKKITEKSQITQKINIYASVLGIINENEITKIGNIYE